MRTAQASLRTSRSDVAPCWHESTDRAVPRWACDIPCRRHDRIVGRRRAADGSVTGSARASVVACTSSQDVGRSPAAPPSSRSIPLPPRIASSCPPPKAASLPAPPISTSFPSRPTRTSFPAPPQIVSAAAVPRRTSSRAVPPIVHANPGVPGVPDAGTSDRSAVEQLPRIPSRSAAAISGRRWSRFTRSPSSAGRRRRAAASPPPPRIGPSPRRPSPSRSP